MTFSEICFPEFPLAWEMSASERFTLVGLLVQTKPGVSIEIGTHFGGSLQAIVAHSGKVHSIDMDPKVACELAHRFPAVSFHTGASTELIPAVLREIEASGASLEFVLVDGDHSTSGVRSDIEALLVHRPRSTITIVLHDSFNPDCRKGLRSVNWAAYPHVHFVDLDFVIGNFHAAPQWGAFARSMWGGFAVAVLKPERREGTLVVAASGEALHQLVFRHSAHRLWNKVARALCRPFRR
jgi:hypothetical protein